MTHTTRPPCPWMTRRFLLQHLARMPQQRMLQQRMPRRQLTGTEVPWFPHDNDIALLKERCHETGRPRRLYFRTPAGSAVIHGCIEMGCSVLARRGHARKGSPGLAPPTLPWAPPAATVEMGKGAKGEGKNRTSRAREVGTHAYLKNFRKGLRHQRERCSRELALDQLAATARELDDRWHWILEKQDSLDNRNEMVWDMPVTQHGMQMEYGSLQPAARRRLTDAEIRWNAELIEDERLQQPRGSASAPPPATPADAQFPWRNTSPLQRQQKAATKAKRARCDEGLSSKAGPPAKRTEPRGSAPWGVGAAMARDTCQPYRDRQAHHQAQRVRGSAAKRSATATSSTEKTAKRRNERRSRSRSEGRGAATARSIARLHIHQWARSACASVAQSSGARAVGLAAAQSSA